MLSYVAKAPSIPLIQSNLLTCMSMQYTVADPDVLHVVTAAHANITCSLWYASLPHIRLSRHSARVRLSLMPTILPTPALFALSYGD